MGPGNYNLPSYNPNQVTPSLGNLGGLLDNNGNANLSFSPDGMMGGMTGLTTPFLNGSNGGMAMPAGGGMLGGMGDWFNNSGFLQQTNADGSTTGGWGGAALGTFSGLTNAWLGMKQYGLAKDALKESTRQFNKNFAAQKDTTNKQMEDQQMARLDATGGRGHKSVEDTMKQYGVK